MLERSTMFERPTVLETSIVVYTAGEVHHPCENPV
jgi:hypothetical protein